jgi:outer membrane immunogenic protein
MSRLVAATAALLALAAIDEASAADLPGPAPAPPPIYAPPPPLFSWTGCYVGAGAGSGIWYQNVSGQLAGGATAFPTVTLGGNGWFGTAQAGCDIQFDRFVIGVFSDGDFGSLTGHLFQGAASDMNESWAWAVGGRVGWLPMPKLLTFLSVGFTQAHFDQVTSGANVLFNANTYNGAFVGSGYEYGFDFFPGLFWKTEYRFSGYQAANLPVITPGFPPFFGAAAIHVQPYVQTISTELVYRFSWGW